MKKIGLVISVVILVILGLLFYGGAMNREDNKTTAPIFSEDLIATSSVIVPSVVEEKPSQIEQQLIAPSLNRSTEPRIEISAFAKENALKNIAELTTILQKDPSDYTAWIALGVYRKTIGDYEGAEEIWKYATLRWPTDFVAFNNLGNLYNEELKNFKKAEENFLRSAGLKPDFQQTYINLYNLYRYSIKDSGEKAEAILLRGLERNSNDFNLMLALARHYAEINKKDGAKSYFLKLIELSEKSGKTQLAENLKKEARGSGIDL